MEQIRLRDKVCVYCEKKMIYPHTKKNRVDWATIEHLNRFAPWNNSKTVAISCWSCNSSRGQKKLREWFKSKYCETKEINEKTVAEVVKKYLRKPESRS